MELVCLIFNPAMWLYLDLIDELIGYLDQLMPFVDAKKEELVRHLELLNSDKKKYTVLTGTTVGGGVYAVLTGKGYVTLWYWS